MNDLEICKRIAEIEDVDFQIQNKKILPKDPANAIKDKLTDVYNPLTDKALCFNLMVKHNVRVEPSDCNAWIYNEDGYPEYKVLHHDGTLQRAICLAIIKADEAKNKTTWLRDSNTKTNKGK